jgi:metal-dependent hydrolase (beta-lactamase superfamily II)
MKRISRTERENEINGILGGKRMHKKERKQKYLQKFIDSFNKKEIEQINSLHQLFLSVWANFE